MTSAKPHHDGPQPINTWTGAYPTGLRAGDEYKIYRHCTVVAGSQEAGVNATAPGSFKVEAVDRLNHFPLKGQLRTDMRVQLPRGRQFPADGQRYTLTFTRAENEDDIPYTWDGYVEGWSQ